MAFEDLIPAACKAAAQDVPREEDTSDEDFLRVFVKPMEELLGNVERVELTDHRFADKHVQMATIHKFRFIQTRKGMAYFEPDIEYRESKFEHIDRSLSQVGAVKGWFGRDIAMVFVGRGEVHILSMKQIQRCAKLLGREWNTSTGRRE